MSPEESLVVFQGKGVRRTWHDDRWYFSIIDVVGALTESTIPRRYWADLKKKLAVEGFELYDKIVQLKIPSKDGKNYMTDCADTEALFRIIQSVPSKRAEPFKRWLARVGYERVEEIGNPAIAIKRMKAIYRAKGYSDDWFMRSAAIPLLLLLLCVPVTPAVSEPIPELRSGLFPAEVAVDAGHETQHVRFAGAVTVDNHSGPGVVVTFVASNGVGAGMMPVLVLMVVLVVLLSGHAALRRRRRKR